MPYSEELTDAISKRIINQIIHLPWITIKVVDFIIITGSEMDEILNNEKLLKAYKSAETDIKSKRFRIVE